MKRWLISISSFLMAMIITTWTMTMLGAKHFGRDHGLMFRIVMCCIFSALLFAFSITRRTITRLIAGFFIGLFSYSVTLFIYGCVSQLLDRNSKAFDIPLMVDQLISAAVVIMMLYISRLKYPVQESPDKS